MINSGAREVSASYRIPAVLVIYTVKSGKSLGSDRERKQPRKRYIII